MKEGMLPEYCRSCEYEFTCFGECPKIRFRKTPEGEVAEGEAAGDYVGMDKQFRRVLHELRVYTQLCYHNPKDAEVLPFNRPPRTQTTGDDLDDAS